MSAEQDKSKYSIDSFEITTGIKKVVYNGKEYKFFTDLFKDFEKDVLKDVLRIISFSKNIQGWRKAELMKEIEKRFGEVKE